MGDYTLAFGILGFCVLLAVLELFMARKRGEGAPDSTDWRRARGIVVTGGAMAVIAYFVHRLS